MKNFAIALCAGLFLGTHALIAAPSETLPGPQREARALALQKELRCVVCQGESLDESGAPLAADLRQLIRARIAAGDSDAAIKEYLVGRYGDFILMKPPLAPDTYLLWFGPLVVVLVGGGLTAFVVLRAHYKAART